MTGNFIDCRTKCLKLTAVLNRIHVFLRVNYAKANSKVLGLHDKPLIKQHFKGISCRMPRCQNAMAGMKQFSVIDFNSLVLTFKFSCDFTVKADLSSQGFDFLADCRNNPAQPVGADMRLGIE